DSITAHIINLLGDRGVLVLPTMPDIAPLRSESESSLEDYRNKAIQLLCISGLTGCPQISLPWNIRNHAPLGLSLLGPRQSDLSLLQLAQRAENGERILPFFSKTVAPADGATVFK
ncbi:MAG: hypothetical protein QM520_03535, partial [Gammaproteobacteria bacterium]|nr:hypothetical protein [Gammaproteobacteria bacterium]